MENRKLFCFIAPHTFFLGIYVQPKAVNLLNLPFPRFFDYENYDRRFH